VDLDVAGSIPVTRPRNLDARHGSESEVIDFLRTNFARVHERFDRIVTRLGEATTWVAAIERNLVAMKVDYAATQLRLDNMDRRIELIEKRLSLIKA
jgi:hypothetical protein